MNAEFLAYLGGVVLSLAFSYVPGLSDWYGQLAPDYKRLVMLGALLLSALGIFALACAGRYGGVTCDSDGAFKMLEIFVIAAIANQGAYALTPKGQR